MNTSLLLCISKQKHLHNIYTHIEHQRKQNNTFTTPVEACSKLELQENAISFLTDAHERSAKNVSN